MYVLQQTIKRDPARFWAMADRIFYGHGACHILAGVFLQRYSEWGYHAQWLKPTSGFRGNHIYVTDGTVAFDYHGYSILTRLLAHHKKNWSSRFDDWHADIVDIDFSLLDTAELNKRNMRGPDQYFGDVLNRTHRYLARINHSAAREQCMMQYHANA